MKKIEKEIVIKSSRKIKKLNLIFLLIFILIIFAGIFIFSKKENVFTNVFKSKKQKLTDLNIPPELKVGDYVAYNHKQPDDIKNDPLTKVTFKKGNATEPGTGSDRKQEFDAKKEDNLGWRVWEVNGDTEEVTLISDKATTQTMKVKGGVGYIWWEEVAHKMATTFGYGYGANTNKEIEYRVGSKIESFGDTETRKIRRIASRAVTLEELEEKLGITEAMKKESQPDYNSENRVTANNTPLRDIGQAESQWEDKSIAKGKRILNESVKRKFYSTFNLHDKMKPVYRDIIGNRFLFPKELRDFSLANTYYSSLYGNSGSLFYVNNLRSHDEYSGRFNFTLNICTNSFEGNYLENEFEARIRTLVTLKSSVKFTRTYLNGTLPNFNSWNIVDTKKEIKFNIKNDKNADISNLKLNIGDTEFTKKENSLLGQVTNPKLQEVQGGIYVNPTYSYKVENNKVKPAVTGLPEEYKYEIEGADSEGNIDINENSEFNLVIKPRQDNGLKIGDIVYYNHKKAFDLNKENLTKVTFNRGSASESGTGIDGTQEFDAKNENLYWRVWDINKVTGEITLISAWNKNTQAINTKGSIGYLWFEETAHKIAGTLGYGYGANIKKEFSYKVGSGIESLGDTEIRKTKGTGAKPLTLRDAEEKLEITYQQKKQNNSNYGITHSPYAYSPLRDVGQPDGEWIDKTKAKSVWKYFHLLTNEKYRINISSHTNQFYNIFTPNEGYFSLATTLKAVHNNRIDFENFFVTNNILGSGTSHVSSGRPGSDEYYAEYEIDNRFRYLVTLKPNIKLKKVDDEVDAWDIENEIENKNVKLTIKNESGENIDNIKVNIDGNNFNKVGNIFTGIAKVENGQTRIGTKENAVFTYISNSSKEINISGIPESCDWKITGNAEGDNKLDLNKGNEFEIVLYRNGYEHKVNVEYENGESASFSGKLKLKKGEELVKEITFSNKETEVSLGFVPIYDGYTLEFENVGTSSHELSIINNKKVKVKYIPEKAIAWVELDFYGDICENLEEHEVQLINKDGYERIYIKLKKSENWTKSLEVPDTNLRGERIRYAIYGGDEGVPGFAQVDYVEDEEHEQRHYILWFRRLGNMPYSGVKKLGVMGTISVGCVIFAVAQFNYKKKFWLRGINFSK